MCFDHHSQEMKEQVLSSDSSRREDLCRRVCVYSYILITVPAVSVSLPGPRLAPGLPSDRTDSRQGKNGSSYLKEALCNGHKQMCAEEVLSLTASPAPSPQASVRPNYQMLRLHTWHLSANTSFHLLADICFISATKTHKKNTETSLVPCFTPGLLW